MKGLTNSRISKVMPLALAFAMGITACGRPEATDGESDLMWRQSRTGSARYAYLEQNDLSDEFIFGVSVINVSDFLSNALNVVVRPMNVKLSRNGRKLDVTKSGTTTKIMSFDLTQNRAGQYEIDFASAGNDVRLRGLLDRVGGVFTAADNDGYWVSDGQPTVQQVQQDADTLVVDLKHKVTQVLLDIDDQGNASVREQLSDHPGTVVLRMFLKRKKALPQIAGTRTVAQARSKSIGYFGANFVADDPATDTSKIQRFNLGDARNAAQSVTFYLKDFPAEYREVAKTAITSWNGAFRREAIKVEVAPANVDVGDPRYHVIKWFDGTDSDLNWAGVAKMITEPDTGLVMSGSVYIQGSTLVDLYRKITAFTAQAGRGGIRRPSGSIGSITFDNDVEEAPVVPYFTNADQDFASYMKGYYTETITHEVGHVLGLRHNFNGSTKVDANGAGGSIMDYTPRSVRSVVHGPGFYDVAAIRWGYFGENPTVALPFCTDEDIWKKWDCSQGDFGDPIDYTVKGLVDGTMLLTQKAVAVTQDELISSMKGMVENALKMKKLKSQMSTEQKSRVDGKLADAYAYLLSATPDSSLSSADRAIVSGNLEKLKELARKEESRLREEGRL